MSLFFYHFVTQQRVGSNYDSPCIGKSYVFVMFCLPDYCSDNRLVLIYVVTLCLAQLVPGWVTVFGWVTHLGTKRGAQVYSA